MVWFDKSIGEAIQQSKASSKLFVVYVSGNDEVSEEMNKIWENPEVQAICKAECVCLRLERDSQGCQQFSQIYPVLVMPVTFLIGKDGLPIEVIAGLIAAKELLEKVKSAVQKVTNVDLPTTYSAAGDETSKTSQLSSSPKVAETQPQLKSEMTTGFSDEEELPTNSQPKVQTNLLSDIASSSSPLPSQSDSDKVAAAARLQKKIVERRNEKLRQEEEAEHRKEIERRTQGRQVLAMKENQEDIKKKKIIEERQKDKLLEKQALDRVRKLIAADRAEKQKQYKAMQEAQTSEKEAKRQKAEEAKLEAERLRAEEREKFARIQYRLPNGSAIVRQYTRDTTLRDCINDLVAQPVVLPQAFQLAIGVPQRVFQSDEEGSSLADLGLVPSASLAVRPNLQVHANKPSGSVLQQLLAYILLVFTLPLNFLGSIWNFLTASKSQEDQTQVQSSENRSETPQTSVRLRRRDVGGKQLKQDGTMHRLSDMKRDDDDESATWNGNSTQQM